MKLQRVNQCAKCPWKKSVTPQDIPNGYDIEKHRELARTIADPDNVYSTLSGELHVMACRQRPATYSPCELSRGLQKPQVDQTPSGN